MSDGRVFGAGLILGIGVGALAAATLLRDGDGPPRAPVRDAARDTKDAELLATLRALESRLAGPGPESVMGEADNVGPEMKPLGAGTVLLDTRDPAKAVEVLEQYTVRRERAWWYGVLSSLVEDMKAGVPQPEKVGVWADKLPDLEQALAELRAVQDASEMEAWANRRRGVFLQLLPHGTSGYSVWQWWQSFRGAR